MGAASRKPLPPSRRPRLRRTRDIAQIRDGRIFIRGRKKDLIVLSTGANVIASDIEAALARDQLFDQVCIFGDGRACLVAVAVLNREAWQALAARLGSDPGDPNG